MPSRISQLWADRPWRRKKQEKAQSQTTKETHKAPRPQQPQQNVDTGLTATIERNAKRLSRIWKNDDNQNTPPESRQSIRHASSRRSLFRPNDEAVLTEENTAPPLESETLLKKLRRRSQTLSLPRPRTATGASERRSSFFGNTAAPAQSQVAPALNTLADLQGQNRPRHVPINIESEDYGIKQPPSAEPGPGMAITSNFVQNPSHAFAEKPRSRPMSSSSSFSHLRVRSTTTTTTTTAATTAAATTTKPIFHNMLSAATADSESSDDDVLTALPYLDFKDFSVGELRSPETYSVPIAAPIQRVAPKVVDIAAPIQRVAPKVVDIVAPRPLSMFSSMPARKEPAARDRHRSMVQPVTSPIGAMEDGPKGDWSRTRHSWIGSGEGDPGQLEWDKLKQFMEAYGNGHDGGTITVRPVDTDSSDSSGSARNSNGAPFSNAQALAALEFGLT